MKRSAAVLVAFLGIATLSACGGASLDTQGSGSIKVVAAENMWGDIAAQIGGSHVTVTSLVSDPNTDPHEYVANPVDAADVSGANLVIVNGVSYDPWMQRILDTGGSNSKRRVITIADVLHVTGGNPNPHLWYWTTRLPTVATAIADQLAAIDPKDAAVFRANATKFDASLKPLLNVIEQIKARFAGTRISYTERVPGYLVQLAGLKLGTPFSFSLAIEDGSEPSAEDTAVFDRDVTDHEFKVLLYNSQVVDAQTTHIKALAKAAGIPIVGVSETLPPSAKNFQAWQLAQDKALLAALEQK